MSRFIIKLCKNLAGVEEGKYNLIKKLNFTGVPIFEILLYYEFMSALMKILLIVLLLIFVVLGAEAYVFFKPQLFPQTKKVSNPSSSPVQKAASFIDITDKPILVGNLDIADIQKIQVEEWAKTTGTVTVSAYSGPLRTIPPDRLPSGPTPPPGALTRTTSVKVIAGFFKSQSNGNIVLSQSTGSAKLTFGPSSRLWLKSQDKIQVVVLSLQQLLTLRSLGQFIRSNDLVFAPIAINVSNQGEVLIGSDLVVFK